MLGKLSWSAIPFDQPIPMGASALMIVVILATLAWVFVKGHWPYLWREWITSVDHKRIGVMYCALALVMLIRGFTDAIMMRAQQALAYNAPGYLPPEHFDQIFSAHGTIMIFFVAMTFMIGIMNLVVPLQLGVRDVAFPTFNSVSLWLTASAVLLVNMSLVIGEFAKTGWLVYPPLSELEFSPGVGVDYYLWAIQISGIGTLLTGINFVTTILKDPCAGHDLYAHADLLLDGTRCEPAHRCGFPDFDRDPGDVVARSLPRVPLLHDGSRRKPDDVRQPHLGVGTPGGLHPHPAGLRNFLGGNFDLFRQAAVRLPLDDHRHHGDLHPLLPGVAAPFLHDGSRAPT